MIKLPLPPGCLPTLWQNDAALPESYLAAEPGYYLTGDAGMNRRRRLSVRHEPHRRHHQRGRPSALHRRHGGGAGGSSRTWPSAPSSASRTSSRASCRWGWWCSRPAWTAPTRRSSAELIALVREQNRPGGLLQAGAVVVSACPRPARARSCAAPFRRSPTARCAHRPGGLSRLSAVINGSDADISPRLKAATDGLQPKRGCQHRFMHRDR
jgi:hypothetical protein